MLNTSNLRQHIINTDKSHNRKHWKWQTKQNKHNILVCIFTGPRRTVPMLVITYHMKWKNSCTRRISRYQILCFSLVSLFLFIFQFRFSYIGWMFSSRFVWWFYIAVYYIQPPHYRYVYILIIFFFNFPRANQICPIFRYVDRSSLLFLFIYFFNCAVAYLSVDPYHLLRPPYSISVISGRTEFIFSIVSVFNFSSFYFYFFSF